MSTPCITLPVAYGNGGPRQVVIIGGLSGWDKQYCNDRVANFGSMLRELRRPFYTDLLSPGPATRVARPPAKSLSVEGRERIDQRQALRVMDTESEKRSAWGLSISTLAEWTASSVMTNIRTSCVSRSNSRKRPSSTYLIIALVIVR